MSSDLVVSGEAPLSSSEARKYTEELRHSVENTRQLLVRLYLGQAWIALGYDSWHEYISSEFSREASVSYLYRLTAAGLIEHKAGAVIGMYPESHMREIVSILGTNLTSEEADQAIDIAYGLDRKPKAHTFRVAAMWVYMSFRGHPILRDRMLDSLVSTQAAYMINKLIEVDEPPDEIVSVLVQVSDPELAQAIYDLSVRAPKSETLAEIMATGCLPVLGEQIPLGAASAAMLEHNLLYARGEHVRSSESRERFLLYLDAVRRLVDACMDGEPYERLQELAALARKFDKGEADVTEAEVDANR